jgi:hypothetical protein
MQEDGEGKVEEISGADANGGPSASTIAAAVRNAMMEAPQSQASGRSLTTARAWKCNICLIGEAS